MQGRIRFAVGSRYGSRKQPICFSHKFDYR
jgi:hypothetical protein